MSTVIDSNIWIDYFRGKKLDENVLAHIRTPETLIVPTITLFEVFKRFLLDYDETAAINTTSIMRRGKIIEMDEHLCVLAAKISAGEKLPMADSMIYATALLYNATLWTQDADFEGLENVMKL